MNTHTTPLLHRHDTKRRRFCDRFGLTGFICLGLFIAFVKLLEHAGRL